MTPDVLEDRVTISWKSSSTVVICAKRRSHLHFLDFGGLGSHILFENRQKRDLLGYIFVWWTWVSYLIWKSTNDRFSNTKCTPNLRFGGLFAHFLFENRPMIDFQIRNAPVTFDLAAFLLMSYLKIDQWSIFKYEMDPSPPIWRPFRSFTIWKSTNDRFSNSKITCNLRFGGLFAHVCFENRPMIDFQIVKSPATSDLAAFSLTSALNIN